jgi:DNA invertase Pin-like site-specific DNA recombinase
MHEFRTWLAMQKTFVFRMASTTLLVRRNAMSKRIRAALYLRVSTDGQTLENQRRDLLKLADLRGWEIVASYEDNGVSGAKGRDKRPGLNAMLRDAKRRRFDLVTFWAIDRLGRSTSTVATTMDELAEAGVGMFAFKESMDTSTAHGRAMLEMAAVFARLEREMIRERVIAGLNRARENGTRLGRPPIAEKKERAIRIALTEGKAGMLKIAAHFGVGSGTVQRIKAQMGA